MGFCRWFLVQNRKPRNINSIVGNEAGFPMNVIVNSQNVRQYALRGQAPEFTYQVGDSLEKRTVWIELCGDGSLIGPFFFERNITGPAYLKCQTKRMNVSTSLFELEFSTALVGSRWSSRSPYRRSARMAPKILFAAH